MAAKLDWTSKLAEEFREYFYGEMGGDYPLSATKVKFSKFEEKYIESVYRELCLCNFLIDYKPAKIDRQGSKSIELLFLKYNSIQEKNADQSRYYTDQYDLCPVHPMQELIANHYPLWKGNSHTQIQKFIMERLSLYDSNPLIGPDPRVLAIAMSMHKKLGRDSGMHSLNPEMMKMINEQTLLDKLRELDEKEEAYLRKLEHTIRPGSGAYEILKRWQAGREN